jgi:hypothetical protein
VLHGAYKAHAAVACRRPVADLEEAQVRLGAALVRLRCSSCVPRIVDARCREGSRAAPLELASGASQRRGPCSSRFAAQAAIATHWTYLQPFLIARNAAADRVAAVRAALTAARPNYHKARAAIQ